MDQNTCGNCRHIRLHYIKTGRQYSPIHYGHCVYPRLKKRETDSPACSHFSPRKGKNPPE